MLDTILDKSIFFSFDKSGYRRHARSFDAEALDVDMSGRVCVVTGANSGIGYETAWALASKGAEVHMICRNPERGQRAKTAIQEGTGNTNVRLHLLDMSNLEEIRRFCSDFDVERIDCLVHNAGALLSRREESDQGLETTFATHVAGPFLMTKGLLTRLQRAPKPRVITVSSGGMYLQKLQLQDIQYQNRTFDGVLAYAEAKRAQIILNEGWARTAEAEGVSFFAMHPGWAATPGVATGLPRFSKWMKSRLRSSAEGADTVIWLCCSEKPSLADSGAFFFDRRTVPTHLMKRTRESESERQDLWTLITETTGEAPCA